MNIPILFDSKKYSVSEQFHNYLFKKNKTKTFSYDACNIDETFVLEADPNKKFYYMTSLKAGVRLGDCIQINHPDQIATYQIQKIEYYTEPADMWMANLLQI